MTGSAPLFDEDTLSASNKSRMNILFRDALIGLEQWRFFLAKLSRTEERSTWLSNLQTACTMTWTLCRDLRPKRAVFWQFVNLPPELRIKVFSYVDIFPGILGKKAFVRGSISGLERSTWDLVRGASHNRAFAHDGKRDRMSRVKPPE